MFDDGRITDSQGRTVDFKNTIIIMTSNLGSEILLDSINENGEIPDEANAAVLRLLRQTFRPEFLNRIDEIVTFTPLSKAHIEGIIDLLMTSLQKRLDERQIKVTLSDEAKRYIIENGYDPAYGARPLRRFLQSKVETLIGKALIANDVLPNTTLLIELSNGELVINAK